MHYDLRDYQKEGTWHGINRLTRPNPRPALLVMATGAGKSIVIANIAKNLDGPVLVLQPSKELVEQNYEKFVSYDTDIDVGIYCAGLRRREIRTVTYGTIQSVETHTEEFRKFKYIIIDEAHQVNPKTIDGRYTRFLKKLGTMRVLGLTATPYRLDSRNSFYEGEWCTVTSLVMLNRMYPFFFRDIAFKIETDELIEKGYLSPILYRRVDLGHAGLQVNSTNSDYTPKSLDAFWDDSQKIKAICDLIERVDEKCQRSLTFCASIAQAEWTVRELAKRGIRAEMVDGTTPLRQRDETVAAYRRGAFKHMVNVGVFTTGFDVPALDCIILARQTMSLALYYQMVGRGVRLDPERPEKKLRVFDLAGVVEKLGRVETIKIKKELDRDGKETFKDEVFSEAGQMSRIPIAAFSVNR